MILLKILMYPNENSNYIVVYDLLKQIYKG